MDFEDGPGDDLILRPMESSEADADGQLFVARKIPESVRRRAIQRPNLSLTPATLDDEKLDQNLEDLDDGTT